MTTADRPPPPDAQFSDVPVRGRSGEAGAFLRRATIFLAIGLVLYAAVYGWSESLVREHALRNRFFTVQTAEEARYDYVILGASHAAVFDYRDLNAHLEAMTGAEILNLATVGGGITINRFLLDYLLTKAETDAVVYVLDSFAFYSPEWNEVRMEDAELFRRAPFDPTLARMLVVEPATRDIALDYISGFSKINNAERFGPDLFEAEGTRFDRSYRPIPQIDRQRMEFLYPGGADDALLRSQPYLAELEAMIEEVHGRGMRFIIVRPPIPERTYAMLPNEDSFSATVRDLAERHGVEFHDFTHVNNDPEFFYDSDHLNLEGATSFFENHLRQVLTVSAAGEGKPPEPQDEDQSS